MSIIDEADVFNDVGRIISIKYLLGDNPFTFTIGKKPVRSRSEVVSRITINRAGYMKYGHKSFVVYVNDTDGNEIMWKIIEGLPVDITLDTD